MDKNKDIITINCSKILVARDKANNIILSVEAKAELEKILYFKKLIEDVYSAVQDKLTEEMNARKLKKIVAGNIVISKRFFGERYQLDNKETVDEKFTKEVTYTKPNADMIEKYLEEKGELPEFVSLKTRSEKVSIVKVEILEMETGLPIRHFTERHRES